MKCKCGKYELPNGIASTLVTGDGSKHSKLVCYQLWEPDPRVQTNFTNIR